jgi:hypothetical protein
MTTFDWTTAIAECCTHLASLGNTPAAHDPALQAIAVVCLIANTTIQHALTPDSTIPVLTIPRYSGRHDLVDNLLAEPLSPPPSPPAGILIRSFRRQTGLTNMASTN